MEAISEMYASVWPLERSGYVGLPCTIQVMSMLRSVAKMKVSTIRHPNHGRLTEPQAASNDWYDPTWNAEKSGCPMRSMGRGTHSGTVSPSSRPVPVVSILAVVRYCFSGPRMLMLYRDALTSLVEVSGMLQMNECMPAFLQTNAATTDVCNIKDSVEGESESVYESRNEVKTLGVVLRYQDAGRDVGHGVQMPQRVGKCVQY